MDWTERFFEEQYQQDYYRYAANEERTAREVAFLVQQLAIDSSVHVLDLACGSGRHALGVARHAGQVTGVDFTDNYIALARRSAEQLGLASVRFEVADMRELAAHGEYDVAYNYFTAWGYHDHATNLDVLRRVFEALRPGGRFLIEILSRERLMTIFKPKDFSLSADGRITLDSREFDFHLGRLRNTRTYIEPDGKRSEIVMDNYVPASDALVRHLQDAGFHEVRLMEAPTGEPLTLQSPRMAAVAIKA
jgi:cyclopropane fatty-acyl-phospholipid synthase-like methyltransferase